MTGHHFGMHMSPCCNSWIGMIFLIENSHIWPLNHIHTGRVKITPLQATGVRTAKPASFIQMRLLGCWVGAKKGDERADHKDFQKMSDLFNSLKKIHVQYM